MTDRPLTPEREQEIRDLDTRFCQYNAGCSCCSFRLPLLAEIDRLRAMRTEAETLLAYQAEEIDRLRADLATAREALIGTKERERGGLPCWCPDWQTEAWADEPERDELHHECCVRAREALDRIGGHDESGEAE